MNKAQVTKPQTNQDQPAIQNLLSKLDYLNGIQAENGFQRIELADGDVVFKEGDKADSIYIVAAGVLGVCVKQADGSDLLIDKLTTGATFGELALLSGQLRSATVYAIQNASLIRLSQAQFAQLTKEDQHQLVGTETTIAARWQRLQLASILCKLFGDLDTNELHQLQGQLTWHHLSNGDVLFRQGDKADGMYIVVNGRLRFFVESDEGKKAVGEVVTGETVGDWALLTDEPRSATVVAVRETNVVQLTKPVFEQLTQQKPKWMHKLALIIVQRQQRSLKQVQTESPATLNLALVPASASVDIKKFAQELAASLTRFGSTLALDSQQFDERYGQPGAAQVQPNAPEYAAITAWLGELECDHAYMLFTAEDLINPWTQRCINQADRVLIVADPQDDPTPGSLEQMLKQAEVPVRTELVLWHPASTKFPKDTLRWLQPRTVQHHHHVRQGDFTHMNRLARRLTGNAIGLVLSGGAALGCSQQGVYKALLELGIPLDYVGGVSMGAIMGGMMACGYNYDEYEAHIKHADKIGILDYTLPLAALTRSKNVMQILTSSFGNFNIEDLWIPYFCVSSSLTRAEAIIHQQGSMWRAIRASMSIPGVFLPVIEDGEVLVDGGLMDNFPAATMAKLCESKNLIGVVISPFKEKKRQYDYDYYISGWRVFWHKLNPFNKRLRLPTPANTLVWAMEINGRRVSRDQQETVDLLITPDVRQFKVTDYSRWRELVQVGYEAALEPLRAWKEKVSALN